MFGGTLLESTGEEQALRAASGTCQGGMPQAVLGHLLRLLRGLEHGIHLLLRAGCIAAAHGRCSVAAYGALL